MTSGLRVDASTRQGAPSPGADSRRRPALSAAAAAPARGELSPSARTTSGRRWRPAAPRPPQAALQRRRGQGVAVRVDGGAAERQLGQLDVMTERLGHRLQAAHPFGNDLRPNAIATENRDLSLHRFATGSRSSRCAACARAGNPARPRRSAGNSARSLERKSRASPFGSVRVVASTSIVTSAPGLAISQRARVLIHDDRQQAVLQRVVAEDIRDLGADHRPEAAIQQRPRRVLA